MQSQPGSSRREFLRLAAGIAGTVMVTGGYTVAVKKGGEDLSRQLWRLNPAFTLREISTGEVEISTTLGNGEKLLHHFEGLEADLFRFAASERILADEVTDLARKHGIAEKECRRRLEHSLQEFSNTRLIYSGEKMLVKIVEVTNG